MSLPITVLNRAGYVLLCQSYASVNSLPHCTFTVLSLYCLRALSEISLVSPSALAWYLKYHDKICHHASRSTPPTTKYYNSDTFFPCTYTSTRGVPETRKVHTLWVHCHQSTAKFGSRLIVHNVELAMNAIKYQWNFTFKQGVTDDICSSVGMLLVRDR